VRYAGTRKYSFTQSLKLAIDGLVSFSTAPLRLVLALGFVIAAVSFLVGLFALGARLGGWYSTPGWASILLVVSFLGGMQLTLVGVVGVYVGRMYDELKARPLYVVREAHGLGAGEDRERVRDPVGPGHEA
jgi:dolichol-phosphate mannosyltransferase